MSETTRVDLTINGRPLRVDKGTTILQAARLNQIYIPTLCDYPTLPPHGSCRLCIVEVGGRQVTPTACTTPVEDGMVVLTHSPKLQSLRSELLQMLFAEHPSCCLFCPEKDTCEECMVTVRKAGVTIGCRSCPKDHQCEMQALAEHVGLKQVDYPIRYRMLRPNKDDPFFDRDYNLCVLCGRCIRACKALHASPILGYFNRGPEIMVGTAFGRTHLEAGCSFCGACLDVCPTGTLSEKTRKWDGKPDSETETTCPLCSLSCAVRVFSRDDRVIGSAPLKDRVGRESLCVEGRFGFPELLNHPSRLVHPQRTAGNRKLAIGWEEAVQLAAEKLAACPPEQFAMIVSADCSNEDLYVAQKFTRVAMRSGNIRTGAAGYYGSGLRAVGSLLKKSQPLAAINECATILCLGMDGRYTQSIVATELFKAKLRGSHIISFYPEPHGLAALADEWLQPRPGEEIELLERLLRLTGAVPDDLQAGSLDVMEPGRFGTLARVGKRLQEGGPVAVILGPSLLAHPDNARILPIIHKLVDHLKARTITLPAEGNLEGALFMGAGPGLLPGGRAAPGPVGLDTPAQVLYLVGEMPPSSGPQPEFTIYQNIYPPLAGCVADLSLPAAAFTEAVGTSISYEGRVQTRRAAVPVPGAALPSWEILSRIARAMGAAGFDFADVGAVQAEIAGLIPGFQPGGCIDRSALAPELLEEQTDSILQGEYPREHTYLGFPLSTWVEGLRLLVPGEINHVSYR